MGENIPVSYFKSNIGKDVQRRILIEKKQKEAEELIGWVIQSNENIEPNNYKIKSNEEYEVVNIINGKLVLSDVRANEYHVDLDYLRKNFELVCYLI